MLEMIDTADRRGNSFAVGTYTDSGTYAERGNNKSMKRLPKAGAYAGAGVGLARAEWSIFEAEAKGPNASAGADASVTSLGATASAKAEVGSASASAGHIIEAEAKAPSVGAEVGASLPFFGAFAKAELASASASVGPVKAKVGLAADTGASIGVEGLKVKLLGTGVTLGPQPIVQRSAEVSLDALGTIPKMLEMIDTAGRRGNSFAVGTYTFSGKHAEGGNNKSMKRLPKAGVYAGEGVGAEVGASLPFSVPLLKQNWPDPQPLLVQ
ncbi:uncharacterized protein LOC119905080 [Micropterus salmoides]|uniref:uncharacterized protein LOC119905080 n=1 Tax=Micropterus salmoides TaxID=27706 RepID=UPI0018EABDDD|nr:uncharacterized protein LOC119905080 [Micropterus salmoides]